MRDSEDKPKSSLSRTAGKFFRVSGIATFLLIVLAVVLIVIPVQRDMNIKNQFTTQVRLGRPFQSP